MKQVDRSWLAVVVAALVVLSACGGPAAAPPTASPTTPPTAVVTAEVTAAPVTVRIQGTGGGTEATLSPLGEKFESTHPNIRLEPLDWYWKSQEFAADLAAGRVPDTITAPATEGDLMIGQGYVADITDWLADYPVSRDLNPAIMKPFMRNGRYYGVPSSLYVMALFYDKTLFRQAGLVDATGEPVPPKTWEEFATAAQTIKQKTGTPGFCALTLYNQGGWTFLNWGWQAGAEFERQSSEKWKAAFDEPQAVQALQFIKDLRWKYDALQPDVKLDANKSFEMMGKHQCGMAMVAPDWLGQSLAQPGSTLKLEDIGLTTLPAGPAGRASVLGAGFNTINAHAPPEVQRAALEWGMWSAFDPASLEIGLAELGNGAPFGFMTRSLMFRPNSPTVQKERALLAKFRDFPYYKTYLEEAAQDARPEPPIATQEMYAALDKAILAVLEDKNADPQTVLTQAAKEFQAQYLDTRK